MPGPWDDYQQAAPVQPPGPWDEYAALKDQGAKAKRQSASEQLGITNPVGAAALDAIEGVGSGVMSTVRGAVKLGQRIATPPWQKEPIPLPEPVENFLDRAAEPPASTAGKVGRFAEQAAEFLAPAGAVGKAGRAVDAATAGMRGGRLLAGAGKAALEGAAAGGVTAVQTGGDLKEAAKSAAIGGATSGALRAAGEMVPRRLTPKGIYQSALRPSLAKRNLPKIDAEVETGLREGIPVSEKGLEKTNAAVDDINKEIADRIAVESAARGPVVDPAAVATRVDPLNATFGSQVNPAADLSALDASRAEFLAKHTPPSPAGSPPNPPTPMTLGEAQAEKQGTYLQLRKKYGELGSASVEAQKALARGLKEEIVARVPELSSLNARDSALMALQGQLERMVLREGNKNLLGLVPAVMAHNPTGFLATLMMDNPAVKSRIAIALNRAAKFSGAGRAVAVAGSVAANRKDDIPTPDPI